VQSVLRMRTLTDAAAAAYRAPFPSADYQAGALAFPRLVPIRPDHPGAYENRIAIERLKRLELPVLLPWGDVDPVLRKLEPELRAIFRNVAPPLIIHGAGHFIQEDAGEEVSERIRNWLENSR
jgi:haloalkane dehalogenase